ncbi:MAG: hypothetical protein R6V31_10150 [Halohasta sp.]
MEATDPRETPQEDVDCPRVSALTASPERTVFTEEGNSDGWIATDLIVSLSR